MRCYAFRDASREETLTQHALGIIKCFSEKWEVEGLKKKLSRIHCVSESLVSDLLLLAGLMHDIGKTKKELQNDCDKECTRFRQHYIVSAQLALKLGYEVPELNLSPDNVKDRLRRVLNRDELRCLDSSDAYLLIVVLPTLLHHYSQVRESSILDGLDSAEVSVEIHKNCIMELTSIINEAGKLLRSELGMKILNRLRDIVNEESLELGIIDRRTFQEASSSYEYAPGRLIAEAVIGILNLCDGLVASTNRRPTTQQGDPLK